MDRSVRRPGVVHVLVAFAKADESDDRGLVVACRKHQLITKPIDQAPVRILGSQATAADRLQIETPRPEMVDEAGSRIRCVAGQPERSWTQSLYRLVVLEIAPGPVTSAPEEFSPIEACCGLIDLEQSPPSRCGRYRIRIGDLAPHALSPCLQVIHGADTRRAPVNLEPGIAIPGLLEPEEASLCESVPLATNSVWARHVIGKGSLAMSADPQDVTQPCGLAPKLRTGTS